MNKPNIHHFDFNIGYNAKTPSTTLKMDGNDLKGVTGAHLRFGTNGITNVVMEFYASSLAEFDAHLIASMNIEDEQQMLKLADIYDRSMNEVAGQLEEEGEFIEDSLPGKATFIKRILELIIEEIK